MPQHCNWVELLQCAGLEIMVQVVEWGCIFEMNVDGVVVEQVVPHNILVEPACCSALGLAGQAFGVALMEQEVTVE